MGFFGKHFKELPFIIHEHYKVINASLTLLMIVRFLALVTTMVTMVDHGNHRSNDRGNNHSNHRGYYDRYYNVNA